ncbi:hypothetical protein SCRES1_gp26 [Synechococcus phage S-CRES1]|nr:hypothetical protein SCRES1_gp26 [Synechococcus phage S-CRES1]
MISDYTVIYRCNDGTRREFYALAKSIAHATVSARELLPQTCEIIRTYHDPNWK